MISITFNDKGNMELQVSDNKDDIMISCNKTGKPMEVLMNFFLRCCQVDEYEWPDFSLGIKPGLCSAYLPGDIDTIIVSGNQFTILQMDNGLGKKKDPNVFVLVGDWEYYCADFIKACNEYLLIEYCYRWADYGDNKTVIVENVLLAIGKMNELKTAFNYHCKKVGIDYVHDVI